MKTIIFYSFLLGLVSFCMPHLSAQSLALSINATNAACGANGTLQAIATGGATPYLYEITTGPITTAFPQLSGTFSPMPAGTYTVRVTDANAATALATATIINTYTPLNATYTANPVVACSLNNGSIQVNITGGAAPFTYAFAPQSAANYGTNQVANTYTGLTVGNYKVLITDACANTFTLQNMNVTGYTAPTLFFTANNPTTCLPWDGKISGSVIGGQAPFTYTLLPNNTTIPSSMSTTYSFANLAAGTYSVKVTDNCGQTTTLSNIGLVLPASQNMFVTASATTNPNCTGNISASASGGIPTYTYQLDNGPSQASGSFLNVSAGTHTIKATDACGNIRTTPVTVASTSIAVNVTMLSPTDADVVASGGQAPYNYVCTSCNPNVSNTTGSFTNLPPTTNNDGTYTFSVNGGCGSSGTGSGFFLISCGNAVAIDGGCGAISGVDFFGYYANVDVFDEWGGYIGTTDGGGYAFLGITGGQYITLTDPASGGVCTVNIDYSQIGGTGCDAPLGTAYTGISLDCNNGMGWNSYFPGTNCDPSSYVNYGFFVPMAYTETTSGDCGSMGSIYYPKYYLAIDPNAINCAGGSDIHAYLEAEAGAFIDFYDPNQAVSYYFQLKDATGAVIQNLDDPYANVTFHNLTPGTYTVVLMDFTNSCGLDSISYTIGYYTAPIADASVGIVCPSSNSATIQVGVTYGQAPYTFEQLHPVSNTVLATSGAISSTTYNFTGLPLGGYKFRVTDACGASSIDYSSVMQIDSLPITYDILCNNELILKSPFVYNATYLWKKGAATLGTTNNVTTTAQTTPQTYTVTITLGTCSKTFTLNTPAFAPSTLSANAGLDATYSVPNPSLSAATPLAGTGTWSLVSGSGAITFANPNSPTSSINASVMPGQYKLLWTVTDGTCIIADTVVITFLQGNGNPCTNDVTPPVIVCPANITVNNDAGWCGGTVFYNVSATDNCSPVSIVSNPPSGYLFMIGSYPVNATATDASGNTSTCTFYVTVIDNQAPVITCPANIVQNNDPGMCGAFVNFYPTATDNCGVNYTYSHQPGSFFPVGTTIVTVIAIDYGGNADTCFFEVKIIDTEYPTVSCQNMTIYADPNQCGAIANYLTPASDNCGILGYTANIMSGSFLGIGTHQVDMQVNDVNGNGTTCLFTITVLDTIHPVITGCNDIIVSNDPTKCGAIVNYNIGFSDNCGILTSYISIPSGFNFPVGTTTVDVSAKDSSNNKTSCSFTVTVLDTELPVISCPSNMNAVGTNLNGNCNAVVSFPSIIATDNCSATVTTVPASGSIFPAGITTVVATATDPAGNTSTCSFDVNVLCSYPPIYEVENDTITCAEACTCCGNTPKVCIPLVATSAVPNGIIGMDFCMSYDQNLVHPTGNATLGQVVLTSTSNPATDAAFSINTQFTNPGELHVSIYYTGGIYNFTGAGEIICVEFEMLPTFTAGQNTCFGICELIESYQSNILFSSATTGCLKFENDSTLEGRVIFWDKQNKPLDDSPTADVNGADASCTPTSPIVAQTDALGYFNYNIANGTDIQINREIGATNVMSIVNGYDCNLTSLVTTVNNIYFPNPYQMIAMDVNLDGNVSAGDITLIQQRIVLNTTDYNVQGKDWQFTDVPTVNNDPSYQISTNFPSPDATGGYYRFNVPTIPTCMPVQVTQNGLVCTKIDSQEFRGILLGDVNGNWNNASLLKTSANDDIVFDLTQATKDANTCAVNIPVYYQSTNNLLSLDFDMDYDQNALQILSVSQDANAPTNLMMMSNNYQSDRLMLTSYLNGSMNGVNYNANPIFWIKVQTPGASQTIVTDAMLGNIVAYFNGEVANATIVGTIADCNTLNTTNIEAEILTEISLYPQPVNDILTITYPTSVKQLALFDAQGKLIQNIEIKADGKTEVDMSALANGVYFLQINQKYSKKVIK